MDLVKDRDAKASFPISSVRLALDHWRRQICILFGVAYVHKSPTACSHEVTCCQPGVLSASTMIAPDVMQQCIGKYARGISLHHAFCFAIQSSLSHGTVETVYCAVLLTKSTFIDSTSAR